MEFFTPESLAKIIRSINSVIGRWEDLSKEEKIQVAAYSLTVLESYEHSLSEAYEQASVMHITRKIEEWESHVSQKEELKILYDELKKEKGLSH